MNINFISHSSLICEEECPLKYKFIYLENLPVIESKSPYAALGSAFHSTIHQFYIKEKFERKKLLDLWSEIFKEEIGQPEIEELTEHEFNFLKAQGWPLLSNFYKKQFNDRELKKPLATECEFSIPWKSKYFGEIFVKGKIDLIIKSKKKKKIIVEDYKTTKAKPPTQKEADEDLQLTIYSAAYRWLHKQNPEQFPKKNHLVCLFFIRPKLKIFSEKTKKHRKEMFERFDAHFNRLRKTKIFKPTPSEKACKFCSFKTLLCPEFKTKEKFLLKSFKKELYPYQKYDVRFLLKREKAINASDIGLGKTVEAIYLGEYLRKKEDVNKILVLVPNSIKWQWASEIQECLRKPNFQIIEGTPKERRYSYDKNIFWNIVNYETFRRDFQYARKKIWDVIILDEAQRIKNFRAKITRNIKKLNAKFKYALTGTPIENRLEELYSIMQFINPKILRSWVWFDSTFIKRGFFRNILGYKHLGRIKGLMRNWMIRHQKELTLENLPKKIETTIFPELTKTQAKIYDGVVVGLRETLKNLPKKKLNKVIDSETFAKFIYLREVINCSNLVVPDEKIHSSKLEELKKILKDILPQKILIFSRFRKMIDIIEKELKYKCLRITGKETGKLKARYQELFNSSCKNSIMLLTEAGELGLNLQRASFVINFDLPFNPAKYYQRIGRAWRLGQKKPVNVINLICKNTVEDRMLQILKDKEELSDAVINFSGKEEITLSKSERITYKQLKDFIRKTK